MKDQTIGEISAKMVQQNFKWPHRREILRWTFTTFGDACSGLRDLAYNEFLMDPLDSNRSIYRDELMCIAAAVIQMIESYDQDLSKDLSGRA
ncbi:hypothetical protein [Leptospira santarosai]|uniref:hypothetical protein n=1 Tax=Leptospira santarosai TaxID=28183 RepID=UPI000774B63F|nr:hypothetical protein [Leptospira santarosai]